MPEGDLEIAYCHACGGPMDVSLVAPFSNVECPLCAKHTRVKREFGPYTLLRRLAVGGMSVVFIAEDNTLGREVVVKILNEEYGGDEKRIGAFEEEARITASFSHPHVVRVFTTGRAFGRFYIAMELVPGGHFEHHIRERGSIPEAEALPLAIQVAAGLKAAHAAGLIHRDVKPGNILLDASGNAKLVDFGLALVTKGGSATAEEIWATPYYVPPETIEGQAEDFRSDIYAFGATFYHALAGRPSCDEETMDTNRLREAKRKIPPLAKVAPGTSAETCAIIERAMAHDPGQRFRSYDDLIAALEFARQRVANGVPEAVLSTSSRRGGGRLSDKLALAGASLAVLGALVFGAWWVMRPNDVADVGAGGEETIVSPPTESVDSSGGRRAGAAYLEAGEALRVGDYDKARTLFIRVRDEPGVMEPTGSWAACEAAVCAYLEGKAGVARRDARAAREHLERSVQVEAGVKQPLLEALKALGGFPAIRCSDTAVVPSGPQLLVALMAGLRNWEHGMLAEALPHFEAVMAVEANGPDEWIAPYQDILRGYLADHAKLVAADDVRLPDGIEACRKRSEELELLRVGLKTKGRAAFNVRSWQLALQSKIRALEEAPPPPVPGPSVAPESDDWMAKAKEDAAACRFEDAAKIIRRPEFIEKFGKERSMALLMMNEAALAFLGELEDELRGVPTAAMLELRDKTRLGPITGTYRGGLRVRDAAGGSRELAWADVSPDSLIELHRMLIKDETSEIERLRRHEQAIAFDALAGNLKRAEEAAEVLALRSPTFKRRWAELRRGIE